MLTHVPEAPVTNFESKTPIPTVENPNLPSESKAEVRAAWIAISVSIALTAIKFIAYLLTSSSAIFSDALESIVNVVASCMMLYAIHTAFRPADREHPYGHGKVEFVAAGLEGAMIAMAAMVILFRAIEQLVHGAHVENLGLGAILLIVALAVNGGVGLWLIVSGRKSGSVALEADGKHLMSDAITSAAVLVAIGLVKITGWTWLDPLTALLVAVFIGWVAFRLIRQSTAGLMDEQDLADDQLIRQIIHSHVTSDNAVEPRICGFHKLRHRHTGRYHWIDFHMLVPATWTVDRAHRAASVLEHEIEQALGYADATAHVEPCEDPTCSHCSAAGSNR
ncbi:MAG: cation diffusion facilitator family transporter [Tepidisphaeraceae bacterium]